ncbi:unnamed protein product [marine sediment metagenome]|uniref:Uncharacterized protein n=1 Tax=marine sediment metagenome TaxID=412755 RepID=X0UP60_9ZZZZ
MIVDITLNQIKRLFVAGSQLLRYETNDTIVLYYVNQGPVIFRTILRRPSDPNEYNIFVSSLPANIRVINVVEGETLTLKLLQTLEDMRLKNEQSLQRPE